MRPKLNEEFVYQAIVNGDLEIRQDGTIWRIRKRGWDRWQRRTVSLPCELRRAELDAGEYLQVRAMIDGVRVYALAHRLVYRHFNGPIPSGLTVNHENGRKKDNRPRNLTLATYSEQQIHATRKLRIGHACDQDGEKNSMSKLSARDVRAIRRRRANGESLAAIAADYPVSEQAISKVARRDRWASIT